MRRAVIYTRVSTAAQEDNTSLAAQYAACLKKAQELNTEVVSHFEEVESGGLYIARQKIQQALETIEAGEADTLITYRLDRSGREVDALRDIRRRVHAAGAEMVFADGMNFEANANGNLMFTVLGAFAENEREVIKERTVRGARAKAQKGRMPSVGFSPYGYRAIRKADITRGTHPEGSDGLYEIVEKEKHLPPLIFEKMIELQSLRRVATWLANNGHLTRNGKLWKPNVIRQIILNPIYKGQAEYGKKKRHVDESRLAKGKSIEYYLPAPEEHRIVVPCPALVSEEIWEKANEVLRTGQEQRSGARSNRYGLSGLMYCPQCGRRMYASRKRSRTSSSPYEHQFRCGGIYPYTPGHPLRCEKIAFGGLVLERLAIEAVCYFLNEPDAFQAAVKSYQQSVENRAKADAGAMKVKELRQSLERIKKREEAAAGMVLEARLNGSDGRAFEKLRSEAEAERTTIETQLKALEKLTTKPAALPKVKKSDAQRIIAELQEAETPQLVRNELLSQFIEKAYPVKAGEQGSVKRGAYTVGGVQVIFKTNHPPYVILSNIVTKRGARGAVTDNRIQIEVLEQNPHETDSLRA